MKKLIEKFSSKGDIIITLMGIILLICLAFIMKNPRNKVAVLTACIAGGLMNSIQGLKNMQNPKNKSAGMSLIMLGILLVVVGFMIINLKSFT